MAFPFAWMALSSVKRHAEAISFPPTLLPREWHLENYARVFDAAPFDRYLINSGIQATAIALAVMATSVLAAYAFARLRFRGREALFVLFLATVMVPPEVALIPNFLVVKTLGWYNTYLALIVPPSAHVLSIFLLRQAFRSLPRELYEAALLDGCTHSRYVARIALPLVAPTVAVVGFLAFLRAWNDLLWPLIITSSKDMRTIQVGLMAFSTDAGTDIPLVMAGSTVAVVPIVLVFLLAQRRIIDTMAHSGLK